MRIAILSDPNNFHTRKWARALAQAGAEITIFSFEKPQHNDLNAVQLKAPWSVGGRYTYLSYLLGARQLRDALGHHNIQLVNALNITPFGVWAMRSGFKPLIASALGADILEFPPAGVPLPFPEARKWENTDGKAGPLSKIKQRASASFYRKLVGQTLQYADLVTGDNLALTHAIRDWFHIDPQKIRLLRWGIEPELFEVAPAVLQKLRQKFNLLPGQKVILSPRGAKAIYQADIILEAFEKLMAGGAGDVKFILLSAGYGIASGVKAKADELKNKYPNSFHFEEAALPREEVYSLWNLVDIFVSAPVYDGYSAALAEGRYAGAVPLVNDIPGNREVITDGENGIIVTPFTAERLASELRKALAGLPDLKSKFAPANRDWILQNSVVRENANVFLGWCGAILSGKK